VDVITVRKKHSCERVTEQIDIKTAAIWRCVGRAQRGIQWSADGDGKEGGPKYNEGEYFERNHFEGSRWSSVAFGFMVYKND
jgi:hypothetical protein